MHSDNVFGTVDSFELYHGEQDRLSGLTSGAAIGQAGEVPSLDWIAALEREADDLVDRMMTTQKRVLRMKGERQQLDALLEKEAKTEEADALRATVAQLTGDRATETAERKIKQLTDDRIDCVSLFFLFEVEILLEREVKKLGMTQIENSRKSERIPVGKRG